MAFERVNDQDFLRVFGSEIELSSAALGAKIVSVSDQFFAEASHLIKVEPAESLKGQFGPKGALYDGWESRRHNSDHDWCILKLGAAGVINGFDIDTSHFNGNEAPSASVDGLFSDTDEKPDQNNSRWIRLLQQAELGPNSRHLFKIKTTVEAYNFLKINIYPDGGLARFRAYGLVQPKLLMDPLKYYDLASVFNGGRLVYVSDQHFGTGSNLLLPGRGKDMSDGWETKRSRTNGHKDWVIIKLGRTGFLDHVEVDTAHFLGNFPESCELHAIYSDNIIPKNEEDEWITILSRTKLGPNRRQFFQLEQALECAFTHVKLTIYPDGGIKRVRLWGRIIPESYSIDSEAKSTTMNTHSNSSADTNQFIHPTSHKLFRNQNLVALPLTPEAFLPYGSVIQAWSNIESVPPGTKVTSVNQGSAYKFHKLAILRSSYPVGSGETSAISVYRCQPAITPDGQIYDVSILERHPYTSQAFIPMGSCERSFTQDDAIHLPGQRYLVVVANNGASEVPNLTTLRAFIAQANQGIMYNTATWHQPMVALDNPMDFACVETQIGDGSLADCEIYQIPADQEKIHIDISRNISPSN